MGAITDWNTKQVFHAGLTEPYSDNSNVTIEVSLTWLETFVGLASIIKDNENLEKIHEQLNHMLFGYKNVFRVPNSVFEGMILSLADAELLEMTNANSIRLTDLGFDCLIENWLIDRSEFLNTRLRSDKAIIELCKDQEV